MGALLQDRLAVGPNITLTLTLTLTVQLVQCRVLEWSGPSRFVSELEACYSSVLVSCCC
jgi:hypothetical protein